MQEVWKGRTRTARTLPMAESAMSTDTAVSAVGPNMLRMKSAATSRSEVIMSSLGIAAN